MNRFLFPLILAVNCVANAQLVVCSDGSIECDRTDLMQSKILRITQNSDFKNELNIILLDGIDTQSLKLFIALSKLTDAQIFAFIDSLSPEEFRIFDHYTRYLCVYHEFDALFKYKYLKEYSLKDAQKALYEFVDSKSFKLEFVFNQKPGVSQWRLSNLFEFYCQVPPQAQDPDGRAFFVLIDFYQKTMKKPLPLSTAHLKNVFNSMPSEIQQILIDKNLITLP